MRAHTHTHTHMPPKPHQAARRKRPNRGSTTTETDNFGGGGGGDGNGDSDSRRAPQLDDNGGSGGGGARRRVRARRGPGIENDRSDTKRDARAPAFPSISTAATATASIGTLPVAVATVAAVSQTDLEVDRVCATIETRWVRPLLALLLEFSLETWTLRFSDTACGSVFQNKEHVTMARVRWSCDAFYSYHVRPKPRGGSVAGNNAAGDSSLPSPPSPLTSSGGSSSSSSVTPDRTEDEDGVTLMSVDLLGFSRWLDMIVSTASGTGTGIPGDDRLIFRVDPRGKCSIATGDGEMRFEWDPSPVVGSGGVQPRELDVEYLMTTVGVSNDDDDDKVACVNVDARRWWTYWRIYDPDVRKVTQSANSAQVETKGQGYAVAFRGDASSANARDPSPSPAPISAFAVGRIPPGLAAIAAAAAAAATTTSVHVSAVFVYALRHLAAYDFVARRVRVRCRAALPLYVGCDLDDTAGIALAHDQALAHLGPQLPPVLVEIIRRYWRAPRRMASRFDAFIAPRIDR